MLQINPFIPRYLIRDLFRNTLMYDFRYLEEMHLYVAVLHEEFSYTSENQQTLRIMYLVINTSENIEYT